MQHHPHKITRPFRAVGKAVWKGLNAKGMNGDITDDIDLSAGPGFYVVKIPTQTDPTQSGSFPNFPGVAASIAASLGTTASTACVPTGQADPDGDPYDNDCSGDSDPND